MAAESAIGKQIREVLATSLRRDPSTIKPEHFLQDDLGLDSLMTFELLYDLEKAFDLEIPNDDLPGLQTLRDVIEYVESHVNLSKIPRIAQKKEPKPSKAKLKPTKLAKTKTTPAPAKSRKTVNPTKARTTGAKTKHVAKTASSKKLPVTSKPKTKKNEQ